MMKSVVLTRTFLPAERDSGVGGVCVTSVPQHPAGGNVGAPPHDPFGAALLRLPRHPRHPLRPIQGEHSASSISLSFIGFLKRNPIDWLDFILALTLRK